ncbi:MAG: hypothetical protein GYB68_02775 [Chloroflexi bacterium]|nr:hypothetical protein [Chloroflexota bacterium]
MISALLATHNILSNASAIFSLLITLFAASYLLRRSELGGDFWGAVIIGQGIFVLQTVVGILLAIGGAVAARGVVHYLYGVLVLMIWPATYLYTGGQTSQREVIIWTAVSAFLFGLTLRAVNTGNIPLP